MKRVRHLKLLLLVCVLTASCSRAPVKFGHNTGQEGEDWFLAGADRGRTSHVEKEVPLPLREIAHFKLSSAPGPNLFMRNGILYAPTLDGKLFIIDPARKNVLSKKKMPGGYAGTLALSDDGLVMAMRYGRETLFYNDLNKTRQVWEVDAGDIAGEPLLAGTKVFTAAVFNHIDAYRVQDGTRLWRFDTEGQLYASPAMAENLLIAATTKGKVYALNALDGRKHWEKDVQQPIQASPVTRGAHVYIGTSRDLLVALELKSGAEIWRQTLPGRVFRAPAVNDSLLIVGASDGVVYAFDRHTGRQKWATRAFSVIGTSPLIAGDEVFFGSLDHHVYALNIADGEVRWRQELRGRVRTSPIVWNNHLIIASEDHDLYIFGPPENLGTN